MRETKIDLRLGDCREVLRSVPDESLDACVTDPPYGLSKEPDIAEVLRHWLAGESYTHGSKGFMGSAWDSFVPGPEYWREVYRVLKPGAYLLAFCGTRTWDLLSIAIRFAGFENRDTIRFDGPPALGWAYFTGFPKSHAVGKAIDRAAGVERTEGAREWVGGARSGGVVGPGTGTSIRTIFDTPASPEAEQYEGFGTALKPAWEVILVFRKPLIGTVAANVLAHGTGALNIDACRVPGGMNDTPESWAKKGAGGPCERPRRTVLERNEASVCGRKNPTAAGTLAGEPAAFSSSTSDYEINWQLAATPDVSNPGVFQWLHLSVRTAEIKPIQLC